MRAICYFPLMLSLSHYGLSIDQQCRFTVVVTINFLVIYNCGFVRKQNFNQERIIHLQLFIYPIRTIVNDFENHFHLDIGELNYEKVEIFKNKVFVKYKIRLMSFLCLNCLILICRFHAVHTKMFDIVLSSVRILSIRVSASMKNVYNISKDRT